MSKSAKRKMKMRKRAEKAKNPSWYAAIKEMRAAWHQMWDEELYMRGFGVPNSPLHSAENYPHLKQLMDPMATFDPNEPDSYTLTSYGKGWSAEMEFTMTAEGMEDGMNWLVNKHGDEYPEDVREFLKLPSMTEKPPAKNHLFDPEPPDRHSHIIAPSWMRESFDERWDWLKGASGGKDYSNRAHYPARYGGNYTNPHGNYTGYTGGRSSWKPTPKAPPVLLRFETAE